MNRIQNVIFDFDGTIVDSQYDIKESFEKAIFKIKRVKINASLLKIGPPLDDMVRIFVPNIENNEVNEIVTTFRSIYNGCRYDKTACYEGVEKLLFFLKFNKIRIFIATNKPEYLTQKILDKLKINFFDDINTFDKIHGTKLTKKEMVSLLVERNNLNKVETIMVGDSASDIHAALENIVNGIGFGYGYESKEIIVRANPYLFFDTVEQFEKYLQKEIN